MRSNNEMTVICKVLHDDFTWEIICVDVVIDEYRWLNQLEDWARAEALKRLKSERITSSTDIVLPTFVYRTNEDEDIKFFKPYTSGNNPNARLSKQYALRDSEDE